MHWEIGGDADGGPALFMSGKLKIEGDVMGAARLATYFRIPSPAPGA